MCGSSARWCARADAILDIPDMHVLSVEMDDQQRLVLTVESGQLAAACPACGVMAVGHGRRVRVLHDAPCFGRVTLLRWLVRIWRCREPLCPTTTFSETHDVAPRRMVLTTRAVAWATSALSYDDTTVSALARHLGVDWHTCWDAVELEAKARTTNPDRLKGVKTLGVDEHIWRPSRIGIDRAVTIIVDLSRDQAGCLHARLLDAVVGRSGGVYKAWLKAQPEEFIDDIEHAALDPFRGYANAIHDQLPDAVAVLDAFHVVRLGTQVVDEVRRRVQQETLGRRGHKTTRSTRSGDCSGTASNTSPTSSRPRSATVSPPATHTTKSTSPGSATSSCDPSTTPPRRRAARSPRRYSTASTPVRSLRLPGSGAPSVPGRPRSWRISTPQESPTEAPKPST
jgi:transposase